jgi:hypothetical protein
MTTPETPTFCTFDGAPDGSVYPYRPGVDDMGGAAFEDDAQFPPRKREQVAAGDINQIEELVVRACRMVPAAKFDITYNSSGLSLNGFKSVNSTLTRDDVTLSSVTHPTLGPSIRVGWAVHKLPPATVGPTVTMISNSTGGGAAIAQFITGLLSGFWISYTAGGYFRAVIEIDGDGEFGFS